MTNDQPDDATDAEPFYYERQAGPDADEERGGAVGVRTPSTATFEDAHHAGHDGLRDPGVWRPPNREEYRALREAHEERETGVRFEAAYVAVLDGFQSDTPGYSGPVAVVLWGYPSAVEVATFRPGADPDPNRRTADFREPEGARVPKGGGD